MMKWPVILVLLLPVAASSQELKLDEDGWHSWRFAAHDSGGDMCCHRLRHGAPIVSACELDGAKGRYTVAPSSPKSSSHARAYALVENGVTKDLHVLSDSCPASTRSNIRDLGLVAGNTSLAWFRQQIAVDIGLADDALLGIAVHTGDEAFDTLKVYAGDVHQPELRKDALFWMAVQRGDEARDTIEMAIASDSSADVREHAVFALYQIDSSTDALSKLVTDRNLSMQVRKQALFWLAHSDSDDAFAVLDALLVK